MNGKTLKTIVAGVVIVLVTALVTSLVTVAWGDSKLLVEVQTDIKHITRQIDTLALDVKENRRLLSERRGLGRFGERL